jgi:NAD dependent epimerase/dehydratase family enzyme
MPVQNAAFARALGSALRRPALLPFPAAILRRLAGDLAEELLLSGQRVVPTKAVSSGFAFVHDRLDTALAAMLGSGADRAGPSGQAQTLQGGPLAAASEKP